MRFHIINNFKDKSDSIRAILFLILFIVISHNLWSQQTSGGRIILHNADSLLGAVDGMGHIRTYIGNVRLEQGNVRLFCDVAKHFMDLNKVELRGNVVILQDDMTLSSPSVDYSGSTGLAESSSGVVINDSRSVLIAPVGIYSVRSYIAEFMGDVTIEDDSVTIYADRILYNRKSKNSFAYGDVYIRGKHTNAVLTGNNIEYYPSRKYTIATGKPVLFQIDTISGVTHIQSDTNSVDSIMSIKEIVSFTFDTLSISCDTMEAFRDSDRELYHFTRTVEMSRGNVLAKSDLAIYDKKADSINLYGNPVIWYDSTQLFSDSTVIYMTARKLSKIVASGTAFAGTLSDSLWIDRINQLTGNELRMVFENDSLRKILTFGDSKSLYFLIDEEGSEGVSRSSADTILIEMDENKPATIKWVGAVEGEFFPEIMIGNNPADYNLPSFRWEYIKPQKKILRPRKSFD